MMIWAFNWTADEDAQLQIYKSLLNGKSRFGWSQRDEHNLKLEDNWTDEHSKQLFLLQVKPNDWIVHVNTPEWGRCVAARVLSEYDFDDGLPSTSGRGINFRHCFSIDVDSMVEFDRNDPNVVPTVNLKPRQRYHRIYAVQDFHRSIENLKQGKVELQEDESREEYHLRNKTDKILTEIAQLIHETHKGKGLERFLARVFREIPGVIEVNENGFGWGTDYGADLIVTTKTSLCNLEFENRIIVQVKSFEGEQDDLSAVDQVKTGIEKFDGKAGMVITTATATPELESYVQKVSEEIDRPIDLLASDDLAKLLIRYAPNLLFNL